MHAPSRSRSGSIALSGALLAAVAALAGCGDDDEPPPSAQVEAADGIYRPASGVGSGGARASRRDDPRNPGADERPGRDAPSRRGGFGSSGRSFHFGS